MLKSSWNNVKQCWNGKLKIDYRVFFFEYFILIGGPFTIGVPKRCV
jgi:hypothetical protein